MKKLACVLVRACACGEDTADRDDDSDGFSTTVLPAASAGASLSTALNAGKFHGTTAATTPSGTRRCATKLSLSLV
jgi:hypothetical protein